MTSSTPGNYKTVLVYESSRAAGANNAPEHLATLSALTPSTAGAATATTITVDPTKGRQKITGFGTALTETTVSTIAILNQAQQTEIYNALYAPATGATGGSGYTMSREHIGSCDFALSSYTYDDMPAGQTDATLAHFSIAHDMTYIVPGLKAAQTAAGGNLKILGSLWTPPAWMKTTNNEGMQSLYGGSLNTNYYGAFAEYLSKFSTAYKGQGLDVWAITPTNEPLGVGESRESVQWDNTMMNTFIKTNLGPTFGTDGVSTKIFMFDHNKATTPSSPLVAANGPQTPLTWAMQLYGDKTTNPFLQGMSVHWYDSTANAYEGLLDQIHAIDTTKDILFAEGTADGFIFNTPQSSNSLASITQIKNQISNAWGPANPADTGNHHFGNDNWFWNISEYDWGFAYGPINQHPEYAPVTRYARDIIVGLNHWYTGWLDWCGVLNKYGAIDANNGGIGTGGAGKTEAGATPGQPGVSHIVNGNPATIMVDEDPSMTGQTGTIYYTPLYYVIGHISRFIQPGATVLQTTYGTTNAGDNTAIGSTQSLFATSAQNPDGTTTVVLFNSATSSVNYTVNLGTQAVTGMLPAQSIQTLVWK